MLVRLGVDEEDELADNDDHDPDQPSYREDNESFDMICQLSEEKEKLKEKVQRRKKHKQENATLKKAAAEAEKEIAELKDANFRLRLQYSDWKSESKQNSEFRGTLFRSRKEAEALRSRVDALESANQALRIRNEELEKRPEIRATTPPPPPAATPGLRYIFVLMYRYRQECGSGMDEAETKGIFADLETANKALKEECVLTFDNWEYMHDKTKRGPRDAKLEHVEPDDNKAWRWKNSAGELRAVVNELESGKGFMWVEKQDVKGPADVKELKDMVKKLKGERRQMSLEFAAFQPPAPKAPMSVPDPSSGPSTPLFREPSSNADTHLSFNNFRWPSAVEVNPPLQPHAEGYQAFYPTLPAAPQDTDFTFPEAQPAPPQPDLDVRKHESSPQATVPAQWTPEKAQTPGFDTSRTCQFGSGDAGDYPVTPTRVKSESMSPAAGMGYGDFRH